MVHVLDAPCLLDLALIIGPAGLILVLADRSWWNLEHVLIVQTIPEQLQKVRNVPLIHVKKMK